MARTSTVTADDEQVDLWSPITRDDLEENLGIFNMFDRAHGEWAKGQGGYERIFIFGVGNYSTYQRPYTAGTTSLTYDAAILNAPITLDVDTHVYHAFELEKETSLRIKIPLMEKMIGKSVYGLSLKMDDDAAGMMDDNPTNSNTVGALLVALDEEDVRTAARHLDDSLAPVGDRFFIMSPAQRSHFYGVERFVNMLYGSAVGNLSTQDQGRGFFGPGLYDCKWYVSGNVEGSNSAGHKNAMFHREMVATAVQEEMRVATMYEIDDDADKHAVHSVYGLMSQRGSHLVYLPGL